MKRRFYCVIFIVLAGFRLHAQQQSQQTLQGLQGLQGQGQQTQQSTATQFSGLGSTTPNSQLAMANSDYRVTAGDIYTLVYAAGTTPVTYQIVVDTTYRIRVSNLGVINAAGKTFQQLKREVEAVVSNNYPLSGVQLILTQPASFKVYIRGEVKKAQDQIVWALSRLSTILYIEDIDNIDNSTSLSTGNTNMNILTSYSSIRNITITSAGKQTKTYDLFKAQRFGDLQEDPYVRPDDVITVNRVERVIKLTGAVERPGSYQLLKEENLSELIQYYGSGYTPLADPSRIELVRYVEAENISGKKIFLNSADVQSNYPLHNYDDIVVPLITDLIPVIFVEGAVRNISTGILTGTEVGAVIGAGTSELSTDAELNSANRLTVRFNPGENYASLVQRNMAWFTAISDTQNAYIIRKGNHIPLNLNPMLYDANYRSEYFLEESDTLIVPFRQYFISVAGAVVRPGRYPYIPDRDWEYYIGLAGGFDRAKNSRESITIQDIMGNRRSKSDPITPETVITANTNAFLFYFREYAPVVTTILGLISTTISILAATGYLTR